MKLKEIINKFDKSSIKAGDGLEKGKYPLYTCSPLVNKFLNDYIYDGEAIIISTGGNFSIHYVNGKFNYSTDCYVFNTDKLDMKYLYYYLMSKTVEINKLFRGAGLKHLNKNEFSLIDVDVIDIEKQKKIVVQLDKVNNLIELRKNQLNKFEELIKSQFIEMFGNKENGFKYLKKDFCNCVTNMLKGPFGSDIKKSLYVPKSQSAYKVYIQINAINKNQKLGNYYISKDYFESKMFKFELKPKDYIATCDGTLGKLLRLDKNMEKGIISASLLRITLNEKIITPEYFENVWNIYMLDEMKKDIRNACLTHLPSAKVIGKIKIPIPNLEIQKEFSNIVKQVNKQRFEFEKNLNKLKEIQSALMQEYFG